MNKTDRVYHFVNNKHDELIAFENNNGNIQLAATIRGNDNELRTFRTKLPEMTADEFYHIKKIIQYDLDHAYWKEIYRFCKECLRLNPQLPIVRN